LTNTRPVRAERAAAIRKAALIVNPTAGIRRAGRDARELEKIRAVFERAGVETTVTTTRGPDEEPDTLPAIAGAPDAVIACGGDGTVNAVLQALVRDSVPAALGVVPQGSGNLLARELGMPKNGAAAAQAILGARRQAFPVACMETMAPEPLRRRYWIAAAGVGVDAHLLASIDRRHKARFGIAAYYAAAARHIVFGRHPFIPFGVQWATADGRLRTEQVTQVVMERIGYFGACVEAAGTPDLGAEELRLVLFKSARRLAYVQYGARHVAHLALGHRGGVADVEAVRTRELICYPLAESSAVRTVGGEADGEPFADLPLRIFLTESTVDVLVPRG
jgi:diacylglycerol kinase family enzyme